LAGAVVTVETERIKGSNPWCWWRWWWWWFIFCKVVGQMWNRLWALSNKARISCRAETCRRDEVRIKCCALFGFLVWNYVKWGEYWTACLSTQHNIAWGLNILFKGIFHCEYRIRTYRAFHNVLRDYKNLL
jgi:hypothetical protein